VVKARWFLGSAAAGGLLCAHIATQGASASGGSPQPATVAAAPADVSGIVAWADRFGLLEYDWDSGEDACMRTLWQGESGWSQYADTRKSGLDPAGASVFAYGIPQARGHGDDIDGVTAPYPPSYNAANPAGLGGDSDPYTQVRWGEWYVHYTYGSPCAALSFKQAHNDEGY
jgi:hypothetical protein